MNQSVNRTVNIFLNSSPAIKEMNRLEKKFFDAKRGLKGLAEGSKEWVAQLAKIDQAGEELVKFQKQLDITGLSTKQLARLSRNLRNMAGDMKPGTQAFKDIQAQIEKVELQLGSVRGKSLNFWQTFKASALGSGAGLIFSQLLTQAGSWVMQAIPQMIRKNAELADSFADVKRYTNLTATEVEELDKKLMSFNTRTSREELLRLAGEAGKIGIEGVDNIAKFVKKADEINVALGDDLGQDAITQIAKLNNLWETDKVYGYGEALTKTGSAINSLGQAGIATESYIVDATTRLGGMASQAKITQTDVLGLVAGMEELGITSELGTTAINQLWADMLKNSAHYAKIAKVDLATFSKMLKTDFNNAFMLVLKGLGGTSAGLEGLVKQLAEGGVEGSRATAVFAALSSNVDKLKDKQRLANTEFSKGTSILNEFNAKNDNLAGSWEKIGKAIGTWWTDSRVNSSLQNMVGWLERLLVVKQKVSDQISNEMVSLNTYRIKIMDVNTSHADRVKLIKELQAMYPGYLGNLDAETVSNNTLATAIDNVNKKMLVKKLVTEKLEDIQPDIDKMDEFQKRMLSKTGQLQGLLASFSVGRKAVLNFLFKEGLGDAYNNRITEDIVKVADAQIKTLQAKGEDITKIAYAVASTISKSGKDQNLGVTKVLRNFWNEIGPYGSVTKLYNQAKANVDKQLKDAADMEKRLTDSLGVVEPAIPAPTDKGNTGNTGNATVNTDLPAEKTLKTYDLLLEKYRDLNQKLTDYRAQFENANKSELDSKIEEVRKRYRELLDDNSDALTTLEENEKDARENLAKATKEGDQKAIKHYKEQIAKLQAEQKVFIQARFDVECQGLEEEQKVKDQFREEEAKKSKDAENKAIEASKEAYEKILLETLDPLSKQVYETEKHYDELIKLAEKFGFDSTALEAARVNALEAIRRKAFEEDVDSFVRYYQEADKLASNIIDLANTQSQNEIQASEKTKNAKIKDLDRFLKFGIITEEQYNAQKEKLEQEAHERQAELQAKQFERNKIAKAAQVAIDTVVAIMKAWATDPVTAPFLTPIIAAAGIAAEAQILSTKTPEYGDGGKLMEGPSHLNGGMAIVDANGNKVMEVEGGEPVFSKAAYDANPDVFDWLMKATAGGRKVRFSLPKASFTQMPGFSLPTMVNAANYGYGRPSSTNTTSRVNTVEANTINALVPLIEKLIQQNQDNFNKIDSWQENLEVVNYFTKEDIDRKKLEGIKAATNVFYKKQ